MSILQFLKKDTSVVPENDNELKTLLSDSVFKEVNDKIRDVVTSPATSETPKTRSKYAI